MGVIYLLVLPARQAPPRPAPPRGVRFWLRRERRASFLSRGWVEAERGHHRSWVLLGLAGFGGKEGGEAVVGIVDVEVVLERPLERQPHLPPASINQGLVFMNQGLGFRSWGLGLQEWKEGGREGKRERRREEGGGGGVAHPFAELEDQDPREAVVRLRFDLRYTPPLSTYQINSELELTPNLCTLTPNLCTRTPNLCTLTPNRCT